MKATVVLPLKRGASAKQRLAAGMDEERRRQLVLAMATDVMDAIGRARLVERVLVVTGDPDAAALAEGAGAEVIDDPGDAGHREAASAGVTRAIELGACCVALLPGDCPLLDPRELDSLLTALPPSYVAIVPDRHGTGTNGLVLAPPGVIAPSFGEGSCRRHVEAAREAGVPFAVEPLKSMGLDLDTPADVIALTQELESGRGRAPATARIL